MGTFSRLGSASLFSTVILLGLSRPFSQTAPSLYRINCSGPAFTDAQGTAWSEDTYYTSGMTYTGDDTFTASSHPELYQDVRWNDPQQPEPMKYTFPVTEGPYTVRFHFAEIWSGAFFEGGRVFNVIINGTRVMENLDIFKEVGQMAPLVMSFVVAAETGSIVIEFVNVTQNAAVAGIEILPPAAAPVFPSFGNRSLSSPQALQRVHVSLSGSLSLLAPAGSGGMHLLDLHGRRVASKAVPQAAHKEAHRAGKVVFEGLRPGMYFAVPGR